MVIGLRRNLDAPDDLNVEYLVVASHFAIAVESVIVTTAIGLLEQH